MRIKTYKYLIFSMFTYGVLIYLVSYYNIAVIIFTTTISGQQICIPLVIIGTSMAMLIDYKTVHMRLHEQRNEFLDCFYWLSIIISIMISGYLLKIYFFASDIELVSDYLLNTKYITIKALLSADLKLEFFQEYLKFYLKLKNADKHMQQLIYNVLDLHTLCDLRGSYENITLTDIKLYVAFFVSNIDYLQISTEDLYDILDERTCVIKSIVDLGKRFIMSMALMSTIAHYYNCAKIFYNIWFGRLDKIPGLGISVKALYKYYFN